MFEVILCATPDGAIGRRGQLLYRIQRDMAYFSATTAGAVVIMGRRTFESLPPSARPLPGRVNVVLTRQCVFDGAAPHLCCRSLDEALEQARLVYPAKRVFVIGGAQLYDEAFAHPACGRIHCTLVYPASPVEDADARVARFADIRATQWRHEAVVQARTEWGRDVAYEMDTYVRRNLEELQYLEAIASLLPPRVPVRTDRTGVGTYSRFGAQMRFDLRYHFPLLTTKRVFWRGVVEELLWIVRGCTSAPALAERGVHIWDANATRAFLDKRGLQHHAEGDLGPVYGFQWRHSGATYRGADADYTGEGVDQLAECVRMIREDPYSRRIVMSAWNPSDLGAMALPPCHMFCQFYVCPREHTLSCHMYQRSADMGLGVPFNIASYALLTCMMAHVCGLRPGAFVHSIGDMHVYTTHEAALREQVQREPHAFPTLTIARAVDTIDAFVASDFVLSDYRPMRAIRMEMAV